MLNEPCKPVCPDVSVVRGRSPLTPIASGNVKYFHFSQNNTGGRFSNSDDLAENVVIAARSAKEANERAQALGVYFDGVSKDYDCSCCGDRWSEAYQDSDSDAVPSVYGTTLVEYYVNSTMRAYNVRKVTIVHNADGTRETWSRADVTP